MNTNLKVTINGFPLNIKVFRGINKCLRLNLVYFLYEAEDVEGDISFPILFNSTSEAIRFYEGFCDALYNEDSEYIFDGEAHFSPALYTRFRENKQIHKSTKQKKR